jgi:hypothetical protein
MAVRIEALADRLEFDHVVALQDRIQLLLRHFHARKQGLEPLVPRAVAFGHAFDGAAEIVGDREQVAKHRGGGIPGHVGALAFGPAAQVLGFRERTQKLVLELGRFGLELCDPLFGRRLGVRGLGAKCLGTWHLGCRLAGCLLRMSGFRASLLLGFVGFGFGLRHASEKLLFDT